MSSFTLFYTGLFPASASLASKISGGLGDEGVSVAGSDAVPARSGLVDALKLAGEGNAENTLRALEPTHPQYVQLKAHLGQYRRIV